MEVLRWMDRPGFRSQIRAIINGDERGVYGLLAVGRRLSLPIRLSKPGSDFSRDPLGRFWPVKLHGPHAAPAISAAVGREKIVRDVKRSTADVAPGAAHRHIPHQKTELLGRLRSDINQKRTLGLGAGDGQLPPQGRLRLKAGSSVSTAIEEKNEKCNGNGEHAGSPSNSCGAAGTSGNKIAACQGNEYGRGKNQHPAWVNKSLSYHPPNGARPVLP